MLPIAYEQVPLEKENIIIINQYIKHVKEKARRLKDS